MLAFFVFDMWDRLMELNSKPWGLKTDLDRDEQTLIGLGLMAILVVFVLAVVGLYILVRNFLRKGRR